MRNWEWKSILVGVFLFVVLFVAPAVMVGEGVKIKNASLAKRLPRIEITLKDAEIKAVKENSKDERFVVENLKITNRGEVLNFTELELKGRGNATWGQMKKPYQIKLPQKADLLGLGKRRKWILLANFIDATNLRTDTAFYLEKMLGEKFAYRGEFVDLYINGDYEGLYYLTRGIEVDKNAVDLKDPLGVLVELDNAYAKNEPKYYVSSNGEHLTVKDARSKDHTDIAMEGFLIDFNKLELAISQKDFGDISQLIDVESFARYYLLEEFIVNPDAYFTSQYFYKDGPEDKIHAGPAWDFDIALNFSNDINPDFDYTESLNRAEEVAAVDQYGNRSRLFAKLIEFPEFRAEVESVFAERMAGREQELLDYIAGRAAQIYDSALKDGKRWEKLNFAEEVERLLDWVGARYDYFEETYGQNLKNS